MSLIRKHVAVLQAWACLDLVFIFAADVALPVDEPFLKSVDISWHYECMKVGSLLLRTIIIIIITLFAQSKQRNKNSELDSRAGQHGSKNKSYTDSCPWRKD